jgi:hypothetical protein
VDRITISRANVRALVRHARSSRPFVTLAVTPAVTFVTAADGGVHPG